MSGCVETIGRLSRLAAGPLRQNRAMLRSWLGRLARPAVDIPAALWDATVASLPFVAQLAPDEREQLRALAGRFLASKEMAGAGGLQLSAEIEVCIAMQACLPVLNLGLDWYRGWRSIVVYPGEFIVPRRIAGDDGVVHEYEEPIAGEAWEGGPVLLSWEDARRASTGPGAAYSVVIHEFTHKLDLLDGEADGVPPFSPALHRALDPPTWRACLDEAYERFVAELELVEAELPASVDPDSTAADPFYAHLPLDAYAAQDPGEFFAVSSESFFVAPARLQQAFPDWYAQLAHFFRQDPLARR
jgi:Mlc titration factor MtfA (ptsG expression regulator)